MFQAFDVREFHYLGKSFDDRKFAVERYDENSVHEQGSIVIFVQERGILIAGDAFDEGLLLKISWEFLEIYVV